MVVAFSQTRLVLAAASAQAASPVWINVEYFLLVAAALFSLGLFAVLTRKNAIAVLMGVELILNAAGVNLVAFSRMWRGKVDSQVFVVFVIILAAAEAAVALAIVLRLYRLTATVDVDEAEQLKG
jgi:NADH-quinone oxidoreductase subunit K